MPQPLLQQCEGENVDGRLLAGALWSIFNFTSPLYIAIENHPRNASNFIRIRVNNNTVGVSSAGTLQRTYGDVQYNNNNDQFPSFRVVVLCALHSSQDHGTVY